ARGRINWCGSRRDHCRRDPAGLVLLPASSSPSLRAVLKRSIPIARKFVVRTEGLEPSREISQGILSPLRLPFRHVRVARLDRPPARGGEPTRRRTKLLR